MSAQTTISVCPCQAAELTGLSLSTIRRLIGSRALEVRRVGRLQFIPIASLEAMTGSRIAAHRDDDTPDLHRWEGDGGAPLPEPNRHGATAR